MFVCPAIHWIAAWSDTYRLQRNQRIPALYDKKMLPKGGIRKSYTGTPVTSASLCEPGKQFWFESLPYKKEPMIYH